MGVNHLWTILEPVKKQQSLSELSGSLLAVDLSMWIMESKNAQHLAIAVQKPYLRNLFFRVSNLYNLGVKLVFVIDGKPPDIKSATIKQRLLGKVQSGYGTQHLVKNNAPVKRSRFQAMVNECVQLLDSMGVPYVRGEGEAEALCAFLDQKGIVNGCITDDGDAFLYGANRVCRNFTMDSKDPHVDSYRMADIEDKLKLDRQKLIGLAILLGCDYFPKGVAGVGRVTAVSFMQKLYLQRVDVIELFSEWAGRRSDVPSDIIKPAHCSHCQHVGSKRQHNQHGCRLCGLPKTCLFNDRSIKCPCEWHASLDDHAELAIRSKAIKTEGFPAEAAVKEFLFSRDKIPKTNFVWRQPRLSDFVDIAVDKMNWTIEYSAEKIIPLMTRWQMLQAEQPSLFLKPHRIVKTRVKQRIPSLEVEWVKPEALCLPGDYVVTIEPMDLFCQAFEELYINFQTDKQTKKSAKPKTRAKKDSRLSVTKTLADITNTGSQLSKDSLESRPMKVNKSSKLKCPKSKLTADCFRDGEQPHMVFPDITKNSVAIKDKLLATNLDNFITGDWRDTAAERNARIDTITPNHREFFETDVHTDTDDDEPLPLALRIKLHHPHTLVSEMYAKTNHLVPEVDCSGSTKPTFHDLSVINISSDGDESFSQTTSVLAVMDSSDHRILSETQDARKDVKFRSRTAGLESNRPTKPLVNIQVEPKITASADFDGKPLTFPLATQHMDHWLPKPKQETVSNTDPVGSIVVLRSGSTEQRCDDESVVIIESDKEDSFSLNLVQEHTAALEVGSVQEGNVGPNIDECCSRVEEENLSCADNFLNDSFIEQFSSCSLHCTLVTSTSKLNNTFSMDDSSNISKELFGTPY